MVRRLDGSIGQPRTPVCISLHVEDRIVAADAWWKVDRRAWLLGRQHGRRKRPKGTEDSLAFIECLTVWYAWGVQ
jgi:hypothetical protein